MGCGGSKDGTAADGSPKKKKKKESWDLQRLQQSLEEVKPGDPPCTKSGINTMALSEDHSMLASGSDDGGLKVWSVKTVQTECIADLQGHTDYINVVAFDGAYVLSASADKTIRKWDVLNRECVLQFQGHTSVVNRMLVAGDLLFTSSYDKTCRCWDPANGDCIRVFTGHKRGVYPIVFIPDFTPAQDDEDVACTNRNFCEAGTRDLVITGSADFSTRVFAFDTGRTVNVMNGHSGAITCMTVDAAAKYLYTGSTDFSVRSWNIIRGTQLKLFEGHTGTVNCITIRNKILYTGSSDNTGRAWVCEFGECTRTYKDHKHSVTAIKVANGLVYTACGDGNARIFDAKGGALKRTFEGHERSVTSIQIVELEVEEPEDELDDPKPNVITDDGDERVVYVKLFTGSYDGTLRTWDAGGIVDETVFSKDDEEKKKKQKELEKRKKKKQKEELKKAKQQAQQEKFDTGKAKIQIEDETPYADTAQPQTTMNGFPMTANGGGVNVGDEDDMNGDAYNYGDQTFDGKFDLYDTENDPNAGYANGVGGGYAEQGEYVDPSGDPNAAYAGYSGEQGYYEGGGYEDGNGYTQDGQFVSQGYEMDNSAGYDYSYGNQDTAYLQKQQQAANGYY